MKDTNNKKSEIVYLNTEETYRSLQPFKTVEELNNNTAAIRDIHGHEMLKSTYEILDVIVRYSCKYPGVCFLSKGKIAKLTGYCTRTVIRACAHLENFGLIVQYETKRVNGDRRQSSNAIVFKSILKPKTKPVIPNVIPESHTLKTPSQAPFNALSYTNITYTRIAEKMDNHSIPFQTVDIHNKRIVDSDRLPTGWFKAAAPYAFDANDFYSITGTLFKAKKNTNIRIEDHVDEFALVLRGAWYKFQKGVVKLEKRMAYLFAAFKRTAERIQNQEALYLRLAESAVFYEPDYISVASDDNPYTVYRTPDVNIDGYIALMG